MHIQWFPGHMTKALRMMQEQLKLVDSIIYVLDARAIQACFNPAFDAIIGNRPILYVINKCDMVDKEDLAQWVEYFKSNGMTCVLSNSLTNRYVKEIINKLKDINVDTINRYKSRGVNRDIRAMVIGVPNTGKSTLINSMFRGKKTITGDRPGMTRGKQWVNIDKGIILLDTPGTMSPNYEDQDIAKNLAFIGSVNDEIIDIQELAFELIKTLKISHMDKLISRYSLNREYNETIEILDDIAINRGLIAKGAEIDYNRVARVVLDDFRKQRIGRIMLEYPNA